MSVKVDFSSGTGALTAFLFFVFATAPAAALVGSPRLQGFEIKDCGPSHCVRAAGEVAHLSQISQSLAAENIRFELRRVGGADEQSFLCKSFSYDIAGGFFVCETDAKGRPATVTYEARTSRLVFY